MGEPDKTPPGQNPYWKKNLPYKTPPRQNPSRTKPLPLIFCIGGQNLGLSSYFKGGQYPSTSYVQNWAYDFKWADGASMYSDK